MTAIVPRPIRKRVVLEARARQLPQLDVVDAVLPLRRKLEHAPHVLHHRPGAQVIVDQIQERTIQTMKEQEIRDKEKIELHANIERMRKEDIAMAEAKKARINDLMK